MVFEQLCRCNSDLSKEHEVDFFFYMPTQEIAENFALMMTQNDYHCAINASGSEWCVQVKKSLLLKLDIMENCTEEFTELAKRYGGSYDGWGTGVVH